MAIKVLIVDDSTFFRKRLNEIIKGDLDLEVVGEAKDGKEGVELTKKLRPDVITMDVEMPVMDGITAVKQIMQECPTPILMFSSLTYEGANSTFKALEAGAVDFMLKNFDDIAHKREDAFRELRNSIKAVSRSRVTRKSATPTNSAAVYNASSRTTTTTTSSLRSTPSSFSSSRGLDSGLRNTTSSTSGRFTSTTRTTTTTASPRSSFATGSSAVKSTSSYSGSSVTSSSAQKALDRINDLLGSVDRGRPAAAMNFTFGDHKNETTVYRRSGKVHDIVVIGSSTGGPIALQGVIPKLPPLKVPLVVIQHMPAAFTTTFAARLNNMSQNKVVEIQDGDVLEPGTCYIAPGGMQLIFEKVGGKTKARVIKGDNRLVYHPCVDVSFASIAQIYGGRVLAIILTGMGSDGCEGCRMLKRNGAVIFAQNEDTCVVYGMPQAVVNAGIADQILPIDQIASCITEELK